MYIFLHTADLFFAFLELVHQHFSYERVPKKYKYRYYFLISQSNHIYCLKVFSRCICSGVSVVSLLLYIAAPPTFYQIFMNNGLLQKTKVGFHD